MAQKKDIRDNVLKKRNLIVLEEIKTRSKIIWESLYATKEFQDSTQVLCYASFRSEVDTSMFIERVLAEGKELYLPRVDTENRRMNFYRICHRDELVKGYYGIAEPNHALGLLELSEIEENDLHNKIMVMPCVGFDQYRNRLGYGGGFYDKYIASHASIYKIMVAFDIQEVERIPIEIYDCKPNLIITESRIIQ